MPATYLIHASARSTADKEVASSCHGSVDGEFKTDVYEWSMLQRASAAFAWRLRSAFKCLHSLALSSANRSASAAWAGANWPCVAIQAHRLDALRCKVEPRS